jgi:hypothetical protein
VALGYATAIWSIAYVIMVVKQAPMPALVGMFAVGMVLTLAFRRAMKYLPRADVPTADTAVRVPRSTRVAILVGLFLWMVLVGSVVIAFISRETDLDVLGVPYSSADPLPWLLRVVFIGMVPAVLVFAYALLRMRRDRASVGKSGDAGAA